MPIHHSKHFFCNLACPLSELRSHWGFSLICFFFFFEVAAKTSSNKRTEMAKQRHFFYYYYSVVMLLFAAKHLCSVYTLPR